MAGDKNKLGDDKKGVEEVLADKCVKCAKCDEWESFNQERCGQKWKEISKEGYVHVCRKCKIEESIEKVKNMIDEGKGQRKAGLIGELKKEIATLKGSNTKKEGSITMLKKEIKAIRSEMTIAIEEVNKNSRKEEIKNEKILNSMKARIEELKKDVDYVKDKLKDKEYDIDLPVSNEHGYAKAVGDKEKTVKECPQNIEEKVDMLRAELDSMRNNLSKEHKNRSEIKEQQVRITKPMQRKGAQDNGKRAKSPIPNVENRDDIQFVEDNGERAQEEAKKDFWMGTGNRVWEEMERRDRWGDNRPIVDRETITDGKIWMFGDSIMGGISSKIKGKIICKGIEEKWVSGGNIYHIMEQVTLELKNIKRGDWVILQGGGNDLGDIGCETTTNCYKEIIQEIKKISGVRVLVINLIDRKDLRIGVGREESRNLRSSLYELCRKDEVDGLTISKKIEWNGVIGRDGIHLAPMGKELVGNLIFQWLKYRVTKGKTERVGRA